MSAIGPFDFGIKNKTISKVPIQAISWSKFKGDIPQNPPYYAHINWSINYRYFFTNPDTFKPSVIVHPIISSRSWARQDMLNDKLLRHEYGHYLIGCLCALKFQQKINEESQLIFTSKVDAIKFCQQTFTSTLEQYLCVQKKYDDETNHYYNELEQLRWEEFIAKQINGMEKVTGIESNKRSSSIDSKTTVSRSSKQRSQGSSKNKRQISAGKVRNSSSRESRQRLILRPPTPVSDPIMNEQKKIKLPPLPQERKNTISCKSN